MVGSTHYLKIREFGANAQRVMCAKGAYTKMAQAEFDSLLVMPGSTGAFRPEALDTGWRMDRQYLWRRWRDNQQDSARTAYRGVYEPKSIVYSEHPLRGVFGATCKMGCSILSFQR